MTIFICWVVFPLVLGLIAIGCGLLVERAADFRLPGALLLPVGFAVVIVAAGLATMNGATARLAAPFVVALAVAGYALSYPWRGRRVDRWALACAVGVFAVYAAPIVLSGQATFAGYVTLDDTSTWLALADHVMQHGRDVSGLAPSTYSQVLRDYFGTGYPVGAFLPFGVGHVLTGEDTAWLFQPTIVFAGAVLSLVLYALAGAVLKLRPLRALVAFIAAQSALLYGYSLWSGIKEITAAALLALVVALVPWTLRQERLRRVIPLAIPIAATLVVLNVGGGVWFSALLVLAAVLLVRLGPRVFGPRLAALSVLGLALAAPSLVIASSFVHSASGGDVTSSNGIGNLFHRLSYLQIFGIWPAGDFRGRPHDMQLTSVLIVALCLAALVGLAVALRRRAWEFPLYVATALFGCAVIIALRRVGGSSPWLIGKALATASPSVVLAGMVGAGAVFERGRRVEAAVLAAAIAGGVIWSNALAYHQVWLAPRDHLAELETIGKRFAGQGPTLMTEYQPYGVRHFLRRMDPEGASERRTRLVPLVNGSGLDKGSYANLDGFQPAALLVYRTMVLRRSALESRPPPPYQLVWVGRFYEVWQRPAPGSKQRLRLPPGVPGRIARRVHLLGHLPLSSGEQAVAVPPCRNLLRLARIAQKAGGLVAAVPRAQAVILDLSGTSLPSGWQPDSGNAAIVPQGSGALEADVNVPSRGRYSVWLGGSFRGRVRIAVDGRTVGSFRDQLNWSNQLFTPFGDLSLARGSHHVELDYQVTDLRPGEGASEPFSMGPLVVGSTTADVPVTYVRPAKVRSLCGRSLDWAEALGAS